MESSDLHPDMTLAGRAARGDEGAWREIYVATRERLFSLLVYQVGDRDEALDLLQDTYLSAVRGIGGYRGEGSLLSWLCGIALRRSLDWKRRALRRFRRTDSLEGDWQLGEGETPDPTTSVRLDQVLGRLPARQRAAFLLHEWMGYSFREIGEILGTTEATARVHAFRGRETMRSLMTDAPSSAPAAGVQEERP